MMDINIKSKGIKPFKELSHGNIFEVRAYNDEQYIFLYCDNGDGYCIELESATCYKVTDFFKEFYMTIDTDVLVYQNATLTLEP